MKEIPFVKPEELETAREMEEALLNLPKEVVSFAGVSVSPSLDDPPTYFVFAGCPREMDPSLCAQAVSMEIRKKWRLASVAVTTARGIVRTEGVDVRFAD